MAHCGLTKVWMQIFKINLVSKKAGLNTPLVNMCLSLTFHNTDLPKEHLYIIMYNQYFMRDKTS